MQSGSRRVSTTDYMTSHGHKTIFFTVPAPRISNVTRKLRTDRVLGSPYMLRLDSHQYIGVVTAWHATGTYERVLISP